MTHHYLPAQTNKIYSPMGVRNLIDQAEKQEGNLKVIFKNKNKYRNLLEMYHATFLVLALYKKFGPKYKFNLVEGQNPPDLYMIQPDSHGAIPLEVMELYKYKDSFKNYPEIVKHIWSTKGAVRYEKYHLLLAARMRVINFDVKEFIQEMKKFPWIFERIWLSLYTNNEWKIFEVHPSTKTSSSNYISFDLNKDKKFWY